MRLLLITVVLSFTASAFGHGNQAHSTLGNDNNINNCNPTVVCKPKVIYMTYKQAARIKKLEAEVARLKAELADKEVPVVVETIQVVEQDKRLNTLSLMLPYSPTGLRVTQNNGVFDAENKYEWDLGVLYQRSDFIIENLRGGLGLTVQGAAMGTLGWDF